MCTTSAEGSVITPVTPPAGVAYRGEAHLGAGRGGGGTGACRLQRADQRGDLYDGERRAQHPAAQQGRRHAGQRISVRRHRHTQRAGARNQPEAVPTPTLSARLAGAVLTTRWLSGVWPRQAALKDVVARLNKAYDNEHELQAMQDSGKYHALVIQYMRLEKKPGERRRHFLCVAYLNALLELMKVCTRKPSSL
jgi:hypothetical protein